MVLGVTMLGGVWVLADAWIILLGFNAILLYTELHITCSPLSWCVSPGAQDCMGAGLVDGSYWNQNLRTFMASSTEKLTADWNVQINGKHDSGHNYQKGQYWRWNPCMTRVQRFVISELPHPQNQKNHTGLHLLCCNKNSTDYYYLQVEVLVFQPWS